MVVIELLNFETYCFFNLENVFVLLVCFGLGIDVLSVLMRFNVIFCIHGHFEQYMLGLFPNLANEYSEIGVNVYE